MILTLENITKYYGAELILKDVSLKIEDSDRIGLIGVNGAGKSTLLNILYGELEFEAGGRSVTNGVSLGFLRQNSGLNRANNILGEMRSVFAELLAAQERMAQIQLEMQSTGHENPRYPALAEEYNRLQARFEAGDGYQIDVKINTVLNGMGFLGRDRETLISHLSGGEKTRLALCKLLLEAPSLLILDEPTNHLDFKTLLWLENYLKGYRGALLIVSHDRYFLDSLTTSICELDRTRLIRYPGNYTKFLTLKEEALLRQTKLYEAQQGEIARLQEYVDKNLVRATTSKSAKSKRKAIEHMELVEKPLPPLKKAHIDFTYQQEPVKDVLHVENLSLEVGHGEGRKALFSGLFLDLIRGEKVAIIGPNGVGKSSLLKAIQSQIPVKAGQIHWGRNVTISYYEQENTGLHAEKMAIDELWDRHPTTYEVEIRNTLGSVLLSGEDVYKPVGSLSGGERAKLKFAVMMMEHANLLILDEPTNHLDLDTKEVLDGALSRYTGTVLMVSHDRYLLDKVPTCIIEMTGEEMRIYKGNYTAYLAATSQPAKPPEGSGSRGEATPADKGEENPYYRSKKQRAQEAQRKNQLARTEEELAAAEAKVRELEGLIATPEVAGDYQRLTQLLAELETAHHMVETLYDSWCRLSE